jgi:hypothetical protein
MEHHADEPSAAGVEASALDQVAGNLVNGGPWPSSSDHRPHGSTRKIERSSSSDYPAGRHPSKSSSSSTLGIVDVGALMREQDADLLESIHHNGPNQTGTTPVLRSQLAPAFESSARSTMPPPLSLFHENTVDVCSEMVVEKKEEERGLDSSTAKAVASLKGKQKNHLIPFLVPVSVNGVSGRSMSGSPTGSTKQAPASAETNSGISEPPQTDINCWPQDSADLMSSDAIEKSVNRRILSGEIFQQGDDGVDISPSAALPSSADDGSHYISSSETGAVCESDQMAESTTLLSESNALRRCESKERRMNEAAQFAEAVGDLPLTEQKSMRIIDYGDDEHAMIDDDDDDDATEIHVQKRSAASLLLVPRTAVSTSTSEARQPDIAGIPQAAASNAVPTPTPETPIKSRPQWPTEQFHHHLASRRYNVGRTEEAGFLAQLPSSATSTANDFVYKGIHSNPPDVVKRGTTRGNYAQLHRKAWLEVSDKYHRYGKNLRLYYRFWERAGCPTNMFFDWLDSKGEAAGQPLPELAECPRSQLDSDTVLYITNPEVTQGYAVRFIVDEKENETARASVGDAGNRDEDGEVEQEYLRRGLVVDVDGDPVRTGPDGWIFVLRDNVMYGAQKITSVSGQSKQRFHHSSFFGGKAVAAAGIFITDDEGYLTRLYPHSGHYRPGEAHMQRVLFYIYHEGVDLRTFEIDTQQIVHVARENEAGKEKNTPANNAATESKKKKIESLHLMPAVLVACFLAHKARFIGEGVFSQIHQIRKTNVTSVSEALSVIDRGGYWRNKSTPTMSPPR